MVEILFVEVGNCGAGYKADPAVIAIPPVFTSPTGTTCGKVNQGTAETAIFVVNAVYPLEFMLHTNVQLSVIEVT